MAYERIDWENEPSVDTPINEDNLNHMEDGIVQNETDIAGKMDANNPTGTGSLQVGTGNMKTDGNPSYALGYNAYAEGDNSFAFGSSTRAKKQGAYAIGTHAEAREYFSMALGEEVIAASIHQTVRGKYNEIDTDGAYLDIVGGGNPLERKNVETLTPNGDKWVAGDYTNGNGETLHGIYEALPVDSASGNPCVITDAFGGSCKSLKLTLEPIQSGSGTPSPNNVRPISGRTQSVVTRCGKNIATTEVYKQGYVLASDGAENVANDYFISQAIGIKSNTTYHISSVLESGRDDIVRMGFYDKNFTFISRTALNNGNITTPNNAKYIRFSYANINPALTNVQLEIGSTATPYEAYNGESITRTYGTTIYGGSDDATGEGAISTRGIAVANDFPSSWYGTSVGGLYWGTLPIANIDITKTATSSMLPYKTSGAAWNSPTPCFTMNDEGIRVYVTESTVADFKANYANLQICYTLATPTFIPLTAQNITLLHGDNVLTTDADSIEASYSADIALYIAKKIAEGVNSTRSLSKGGSSEPEEETKEEIKEEVKETKEEK